jgi:OOP family OmpA-OmpF porin
MPKILFIFLACLVLAGGSQAQNVQWASEVLEFSSQLSDKQYSAQQILHKPNVLPNTGESPNAWTPRNPNSIEFIKVGYENPMPIQQIAIGESYNPGSVRRVFVYDEEGNETMVYDFEPKPAGIQGRLLNIFFEMTTFSVNAVKVELDGRSVPGYISIDAIGISDSNIPIEVKVNVADIMNTSLNPERLSEKVNSEFSEMRPLISPDGKTLYFSRRNHPGNVGGVKDYEDIWFSEMDTVSGEWMEAQNIGSVLNNDGPNFISSITPDGNTMVLLLGNEYKSNGKMAAGVSISTKTADGWSKPQNLEIPNNYNLSDKANFYMANNRKAIIMAVEREDSYGDRDLYVSFLEDDGKWTEPKNLGNTVNTASEESAPFLAADDETLYFSSRGFSGYGGSDIYVTRRLDDTWENWSEPQNLGPEINSELDDEFFNIPASGQYAYYSRAITEDNMDIFRVELPVFYKPAPVVAVKGRVYNAKTNEPIEAKIFYEKLPEGEEIGIARSEAGTGNYEIILPSGKQYGYLAEAEGFLSISANIDLTELQEYKEVTQDLYLVPVEKEQTIVMNNVFFDFDKSTLRNESFPELRRIATFLDKNQNIKIEIGGHTDSYGNDAYNQRLSERRANAVRDFFVQQGIAPERMQAIGYGETKPVVPGNLNIAGQQENRRVEFKIIED